MSLEDFLMRKLHGWEDESLYRSLRSCSSTPPAPYLLVEGAPCLNFSSNDYLGLAQHPRLLEVGQKTLLEAGSGSTSSRLISGSLTEHRALEAALANFKKTEAALSFANGYTAAVGTISSLMEPQDVIILDKRSHACLIDGSRLSGSRLRFFKHNDISDLNKILLQERNNKKTDSKCLIVTESVFSMDGDIAPLKEIVALKEAYEASLLVDEAHAVGVFGQSGRGLIDQLGLTAGQVDIQMGTLGKAVGAAGGYIAGSQRLIDYLINSARSFIFSTAPPPSQVAMALAGIELLQSTEGDTRREHLFMLVREACSLLELPLSQSPILPYHIGENEKALAKSAQLLEAGILAPAIRYPTVPRHTARLRLTLTAEHQLEHLQDLRLALRS